MLTTLSVALAVSTIQTGQTTTATSTGRDQNAATVAIGPVTWSTASAAVATVNASTGVVSAVTPGQTAVIASAGGKQAQATITVIAAPVSGSYRVAFARGTSCHRDSPFGCDLHVVDVNMTTRQPGAVTKVAGDANVAEFFPALSSSGRFVIYNRWSIDPFGNNVNEVWVADLELKTAPVRLLTAARFPALSSDDRKLYFSRDIAGRSDIWVADVTINLGAATLTVGAPTMLTSASMGFASAQDPTPVGTNGGVAFHYTATLTSSAIAGYLAPGATSVSAISDASGHVHANAAGTSIVVSTAGGTSLGLINAVGGGWSAKTNIALSTTPSAYTSDDSRYAAVQTVNWSYPEWVDQYHAIASLQGGAQHTGEDRAYSMSRLYLVTLSSATAEPLASLLGGAPGDYCTAAVRRLNSGARRAGIFEPRSVRAIN